ncbi:hypothetical protein TNIN_471421 [Trichonephila inaurata madagascariensis]|uniref:Uncharacterized protein n=1 Tax=Trichonephila inaurata madagascariensis TaxID=2747483 RepID=A0A8X6XBC1_9ARAC|nr:hypothetical protein TNIN_471421 [Trichonephila inaurata madagascariensis]
MSKPFYHNKERDQRYGAAAGGAKGHLGRTDWGVASADDTDTIERAVKKAFSVLESFATNIDLAVNGDKTIVICYHAEYLQLLSGALSLMSVNDTVQSILAWTNSPGSVFQWCHQVKAIRENVLTPGRH